MINVLVLNATYEVLNVTRWQRAVTLVLTEKAEILEPTGIAIHSSTLSFDLPSVIKMNYFVKKPHIYVPLSRTNVFLRDRNTCQYCGMKKNYADLTLDHVKPKSRGGESVWENLVTACRACNAKKGNRPPELVGMRLIKQPRTPQFIPSIQTNLRNEWKKYIPYEYPEPAEVAQA